MVRLRTAWPHVAGRHFIPDLTRSRLGRTNQGRRRPSAGIAGHVTWDVWPAKPSAMDPCTPVLEFARVIPRSHLKTPKVLIRLRL